MDKRKNCSKRYCFTIDDNIRFFEEIQAEGLRSVFDHPYLAMLKGLHRQYGLKVHLNVFYSYEPGGFSLADFPECYKAEWEQNADWLRFSFHAKHNEPEFPYDSCEAAVLAKDFAQVTGELERIAGKPSIENTVTLHYMRADEDGCRALKRQGVLALIGGFYPIAGRNALNYCLTQEQTKEMEHTSFYYDQNTEILFVRNDAILNKLSLEEIVPVLEKRKSQPFIQIMIHEQYFYADYDQYQPDFAEKLRLADGSGL